MTKRVALARALALDPAIVFLDEPTSGLDPIAAGDFDALIKTLQKTLGLTVFMVTHDLDSLNTVCDRVAALADGKIVAIGPMRDTASIRASLGAGLFPRQALPDAATKSEVETMETRAPFVVVGAFVLAAIAAVFGFVYWLHNAGGLGPAYVLPRAVRRLGARPTGRRGRAVQRHPRRRGDRAWPRIRQPAPRQCDHLGSLDDAGACGHQGRPGISGPDRRARDRAGGRHAVTKADTVPTLVAEPGAGQGMTQAARDALRKVDSVLTENSDPLKNTIANLQIFSEGLARNTGKLDGIVAGLETMTGGASPRQKITYDLRALQNPGPVSKTVNVQWAIPEPTAVAMLETQRILFSPAQEYPGFAEAMWADALPKLIQARLIESFENHDIAHAPLRMADIGQTEFQLLIDVRRFRVAVESGPVAEIGLSARIVDKNGKVVASRLFEESEKFASVTPPEAVAAFSEAFGRIARNMIAWTVQAY